MTRIHSSAGHAIPEGELLERAPFRAPDHPGFRCLLGRWGQLVPAAR